MEALLSYHLPVAGAESATKLFAWVAVSTGSRNALKGASFLVRAALLEWIGSRSALALPAGLLSVLSMTALMLPAGVGRIT